MLKVLTALALVNLTVLSARAERTPTPQPKQTTKPKQTRRLNRFHRFKLVAWQLHDYKLHPILEAFNRARFHHVNAIIFSHGLISEVEQVFREPRRKQDLLSLIRAARMKKLRCYVWVHELNSLPDNLLRDGKADVDNEALAGFLRDRYRRLFRELPGLAGIVLTLHESQYRLFRSNESVSALPVPDRIVRVVEPIYQTVVTELKKELIVRNFFYEPLEREWFQQAMARLPADIIIMCKNTPHEFNPFYPPEPMLKKGSRNRMIMELDLSTENAPGRQFLFCQVEYLQRFLEIAHREDLYGIVGRLRFPPTFRFDGPDAINAYAFGRFATEPGLDSETVWKDFCTRTFRVAAVEPIQRALKKTFQIAVKTKYHLRFWVYPLKGYHYAFGHIRLRSLAKWTHDPDDKAMETALMNPTPELYERVIAEKDEAIQLAEAAIDDIEQAGRYLTYDELDRLLDRFRYMVDRAEVEREATAAFFSFRMWINDPKPEYLERIRAAMRRLEALDAAPYRPWGRDWRTGHRYGIPKFLNDLKWRIEDPQRAREEDAKIMEEITRRLHPERM